MKYRVYEAVKNDGINFKEHNNFETIADATRYCSIKNSDNQNSTFIINHELHDGRVQEIYYGEWHN